MARPYRALEVPIALLHQKAYDTGKRLAPWGPLVIPEKKVETTAARVISPGVSNYRNLFERQPFLRRFFYLVDGRERVMCRACGLPSTNDSERSVHTSCYYPVSQTLKKMLEDGVCLICEQVLINYIEINQDFSGIPVCSQTCMDIWEHTNSDGFEFEFNVMKLEIAAKDRTLSRTHSDIESE